jgi:acyl transferase domain-containing protein/acyl carrier protein
MIGTKMEELRGWLIARLAELRRLAPDTIDVRERFSSYGLDSLATTRLIGELSTKLDRPLPATLAWEYPTIDSLVRYLAGGEGAGSAAAFPAGSAGTRSGEAIAVVGMACRFPRASDPRAFWRLLCEGRDAITEVPKDRWDVDALFDADPTVPGKLSTRWGGFLEQIDRFDPLFFGITPREAAQMDPQQRLVLELAWEALEDAGLPPPSLKDSRTGVFVGAMWSDYARLPDDPRRSITSHTATGCDLSIIPARVSYSLGLRGPSVALNTACSSSLVAIHYARRSLELGECGLALAGGVNLFVSPDSTIAMCKFGAMAPDGRSKAFDSRANGYVRGEGGGLVVLKPLSLALADGDPIYCVLLGSAVNNDGFSNGLTAPSPKAQELVLREAYGNAGVDVGDVQYVETHGTGTVLGDPIEAGALGTVLGVGRPAERPLILGAVKTNIGHLEAASGVAGLIKTALALKHRTVPPNLHFRKGNPHIPFDALRLKVPTSLEPWPERNGRALAGVSSFGFGGTNCHVVLGDATAEMVEKSREFPRPLLPAELLDDSRAGRLRPVFVFAGQGSQWLQMGVDLLREAAFRDAIQRCDWAMGPHLGASLVEVLLSDQGAWLEETARIQPAIFAIQVALAALVRSLGIEPAAVIGQSMGEVAAAYVAGHLSLDDAARIICVRSRIVGRVSGRGAMAVVELPMVAAKRALEGHGDTVSIAVSSSPTATVLSGDATALEALLGELESRGVRSRRISVDYASHCREMDPILPALGEALESVRPRGGGVPFYSTVTGGRLEGSVLDAAYWCKNLREPVIFAETTCGLIREGHRLFLEIGPHPLLTRSIEECLVEAGQAGLALPTMRRDEPGRVVLFQSLAVLNVSDSGQQSIRQELLSLSAHVPEALRDLARETATLLERDQSASLSDLCYTASVRRSHHAHRLAVVRGSKDEMVAALSAYVRDEGAGGVVQGKARSEAAKVVFVFPGQGSQWLGMGQKLLAEEPAFREALMACDAAIAREAGFSVLTELAAEEGRSRFGEIDVVQPVLFAMEVALAAQWRSWGVEPAAVVGHSMGEIAAAHVAGVLSLEDGVAVICRRSRLLRRVSGRGAMALVELTPEEADKALAGFTDRLSVAVSNGPRSTVIAGDPKALDEVLARLERGHVFCRRVNVDVASHSPQMDELRGDLLEALEGLRPKEAKVAMRSTVTGERVRGDELVAGYWADNLRRPVLFSRITRGLIEEGHTVFLEISPHPVLLPSLEESLGESQTGGGALASLRRQQDERRSLLESLGSLYVHGYPVDWKRLHPEGGRVVALPTYRWQRKRFWVESEGQVADGARAAARRNGAQHPLLGAPLLSSSAQAGEHSWEQTLSVQGTPYLADHRVQGEVVFPGAGYVEMALAAGQAQLGTSKLVLEDVALDQMLVLTEDGARVAQVVLTEQGAGPCGLRIASRAEDGKTWTNHASGRLRLAGSEAAVGDEPQGVQAIKRRLGPALAAAEHYERMRARQIVYGPAFQGLKELWVGEDLALGRVELPEAVTDSEYLLHPALLDACLQVMMGLAPGTETYVPVAITRLQVRARPSRQGWVVATRRPQEEAAEGELTCAIRVADEAGQTLVELEGVRARSLLAEAPKTEGWLDQCMHEVAWRRAEAPPEATFPKEGAWLLLTEAGRLGAALRDRLSVLGGRCVRAVAGSGFECIEPDLYAMDFAKPGEYQRLLQEAFGAEGRCLGVVHLLSLGGTPAPETTAQTLEADLMRGSLSATYLTQALVRHGFRDMPRLFLVTRGAQAVQAGEPVSVAQAPLWGLGRTLALEHPELQCTRIDLCPTVSDEDAALLARELGAAASREDQIALRGDGRYVARIVVSQGETEATAERGPLAPARGRPFRLEIRSPGVLDRITARQMQPLQAGPDEVVIGVEVAGLNFRDVLLAMGALPDDESGAAEDGPPLGLECAGTVVAVGEGVRDLVCGQEVIAFGARAFGTYVKTKGVLCAPKPTGLSWEEAATLPTAFATALYALDEVGRLRAMERVLIHAGAGGVGLAAIQWAKHVGAEIFATAGSEEKRDYLRSLGVSHVLDSRSLRFVDEIKRITKGEGVDVVLNQLAGAFIPASLSVLREQGRFVEIGKRDYYENAQLGLRPFLRSLSFSLVDLRALMEKQPQRVGGLLQQTLTLVEAGTLKPLPVRSFRASRAAEAFQVMAQAKHTGKLAIVMKDADARIADREADAKVVIRVHRSYLITGGLGGLGLSVSRWLVEQGARSLVLVGRRAPDEQALAAVRAMEAVGARVLVAQADVSKRDELARLLSKIEAGLPPLGGIVHAAGVLDDRTVLELDEESFRRVFAAKAEGAWNLHVLSEELPLDFFVMYSSAAALLGSPGQGNYTAANALLDALSHERTRKGLPSMSIQWGPFSEVGLAAAQDNRGSRMSHRGMASLTPGEGLVALRRLLRRPRAEVGVVRFDLRRWAESYPAAAGRPLFAELDVRQKVPGHRDGEAPRLREKLAQAQGPERQAVLEQHLREQVAFVSRLDADQIGRSAPFKALGMDSLMSLELRARLEASLGVRLSATILFMYPHIAALSRHLLTMLSPRAAGEDRVATDQPLTGSTAESAPED